MTCQPSLEPRLINLSSLYTRTDALLLYGQSPTGRTEGRFKETTGRARLHAVIFLALRSCGRVLTCLTVNIPQRCRLPGLAVGQNARLARFDRARPVLSFSLRNLSEDDGDVGRDGVTPRSFRSLRLKAPLSHR